MVAIFVVLTIVAFLVADLILQAVQRRRAMVVKEVGAAARAFDERLLGYISEAGFALPRGIFYDGGHTWARLDPSGEIAVGIDDFAQKLIGRIDSIKAPALGAKVNKGEKVLEISQGARRASFLAPVNGVVRATNIEALSQPAKLKGDPYGAGWLFRVDAEDLPGNIKELKLAEEAAAWLNEEVSRFKELVASEPAELQALGTTLHDGGLPVEGLLEQMNDFIWVSFKEKFLGNL